MTPKLKSARRKLRKRIERHISPLRRPKTKLRSDSILTNGIPDIDGKENTINFISTFLQNDENSNKICTRTQPQVIQHVPIIKSASKTDIKEQKIMKRLRSSTATLQGIENKKSLKRKFDSQEPSLTFSEPKPCKRKLACHRHSMNLEESFVKPLANNDFETVSLASTDTCFKRDDSVRRSLKDRLSKMASFGGLFQSPRIYKPVKRASSLKNDDTPSKDQPKTKIRKYVQLPTPVKRRVSKLWLDTVADFNSDIKQNMTAAQIKRQETIFELYCGEEALIEDLKLLKEVYFNPMSKLKLLNEDDLDLIFGSIQALLPLHEELLRKLKEVKNKDGSINEIGQVLIDWIPGLRPYVPYCAKQIKRKHLLDNKIRDDPAFADFLQRCLESPFSRKLDLWSFLDAPRGRLVKYPLLFSSVEKLTFKDDPDKHLLHDALKGIEEIISEADKETGRSKCDFFKTRLYFVNEEHANLVGNVKTLTCDGCLKNRNGTKLQAFLFDNVFVLTRPATRRGTLMYQVSIKPISLSNINVEDAADGEMRKSSSFKNTLAKGSAERHWFKIEARDPDHPKQYSLQAHDDHDKKQWLNSFKALLPLEKTVNS